MLTGLLARRFLFGGRRLCRRALRRCLFRGVVTCHHNPLQNVGFVVFSIFVLEDVFWGGLKVGGWRSMVDSPEDSRQAVAGRH